MIKTIAIVSNIILLGFVFFLFAKHGAPDSGEDLFFVILIIVSPLFSLIALMGSKGDGWLDLYFKRKALEEKKKIEKLNEKT